MNAGFASISVGGRTLELIELEVIYLTLRRHNWKRQIVANELGIGLRTLYDKIALYRGDPRLSREWRRMKEYHLDARSNAD